MFFEQNYYIKNIRSAKKPKIMPVLIAIICLISASHSMAQTFSICEGEYVEDARKKCTSTEALAFCGETDIVAARICEELGASRKFTKVVLSSTDGNQCGYTTFRIVCK